jgi:hypothetical protein
MSDGLGALSKGAILHDPQDSAYPKTDWADDALGAGHGFPFISEGVAKKPRTQTQPTLEGKAGFRAADLVGYDVAGNLIVPARYNDIGLLIACAMGYENPNDAGATYHGSPETVGGKYVHLFELDDTLHTAAWASGERLPSGSGGGTWDANDLKVRRFLLAFAKGVSDHRFFSCMVNKMTLDIQPTQIQFEFELLSYNGSRGSYNSANWTYSTDRRNVIFPDIVFSLSGTTYGFASARIELSNNLDAPRTTASGLYASEPRRNGVRSVTLGWNDPVYSSDSRINDMEAGTERYISIVASSGSYKLGLYFSAVKILDVQAPIASAEIIKMDHQAQAFIPSTDQFSDQWGNISLIQNKEMVAVLKNDYASNYLTAN